MFTKGFGSYVCQDDTISCTVDGVIYTARLERDLDTKPTDYSIDVFNEAEIEEWNRDEWHFFGVVIDADIRGWTKRNLASMYGIEGNLPGSDNSYFLGVANQLLPDAVEQVKKDALS